MFGWLEPTKDVIQAIYLNDNEQHYDVISTETKNRNRHRHQISNAMKHLLYDEIASSFMDIAKKRFDSYKNITNDNIDSILTELQVKNKINQNEIKYIRIVINKVLEFKPITHVNKVDHIRHCENDIIGDLVDPNLNGLNINTLYEIYNVHLCFLFANYQCADYKRNTLINNITNNTYFHSNNTNYRLKKKK
eukprot:477520_1